eukprot:TRINITY_DN14112_c0_g1_i2.p1 TRINITY_DN14112_c0_g1~~TRINITY_DN14112_c0_g1_i2.p1  ORF type:complete len:105 (+),score=23.50 TRINITY_DN14112_c0_g1_i2:22-315(+)
MIRRPPRSTHCISSAASDVYKRQILFQRNIRNLSLPNTYRGRNERRLERKLVPINGSITRRRTLLIRTYSNHNNKIRFGRNRKDNRTESESAVIPRH